MNLQSIINSRYGVGLALGLGRVLNTGLGYRLADQIADFLASHPKIRIVQAVRANQWVVSGGVLSSQGLNEITRRTFQHTAHCLFDLYHNLENPQKTLKLIKFSPMIEQLIEDQAHGKHVATMFACLHLSNFDLLGRALGLRGMKMTVISAPEPSGGYRLQNRLRREVGLEIAPASFSALRRAYRCLEEGGIVLTGIDRPIPDSKYAVNFFKRPAFLPLGHVRLALKAGVPVTLVAVKMRPDGTYYLLTSDPIPMKAYTDPEKEIVVNAEAVLRLAEDWIRQIPEQWSMTYPVWPEALQETRGM